MVPGIYAERKIVLKFWMNLPEFSRLVLLKKTTQTAFVLISAAFSNSSWIPVQSAFSSKSSHVDRYGINMLTPAKKRVYKFVHPHVGAFLQWVRTHIWCYQDQDDTQWPFQTDGLTFRDVLNWKVSWYFSQNNDLKSKKRYKYFDKELSEMVKLKFNLMSTFYYQNCTWFYIIFSYFFAPCCSGKDTWH